MVCTWPPFQFFTSFWKKRHKINKFQPITVNLYTCLALVLGYICTKFHVLTL